MSKLYISSGSCWLGHSGKSTGVIDNTERLHSIQVRSFQGPREVHSGSLAGLTATCDRTEPSLMKFVPPLLANSWKMEAGCDYHTMLLLLFFLLSHRQLLHSFLPHIQRRECSVSFIYSVVRTPNDQTVTLLLSKLPCGVSHDTE